MEVWATLLRKGSLDSKLVVPKVNKIYNLGGCIHTFEGKQCGKPPLVDRQHGWLCEEHFQ
jgi:hypothetical protein